MKEDKKLQGLCVDCMFRHKCEDAKRHLHMIRCSEYMLHWRKRNKPKGNTYDK